MLFYNRLVGDEQDPSKLKLRTSLYEVKEVRGDIYTLKLCESPDVERRARVGQLIRYRGGDAQDFDVEAAESPAFGAAATKQVSRRCAKVGLRCLLSRARAPRI